MFWKLHRNSLEGDMMELSQLLAEFFSYAACQGGTSLDESAFRKALPQSAPWLLEQFHGRQQNRQDLQQAVRELFLLSPPRRQVVAWAVVNDMGFDQVAAPDCFFFAVPSLPEKEQSIVKEFFKYFYDIAFKRTRGPRINGRVTKATRTNLIEAYYLANDTMRHACPICLHRRSNAVKENRLEHYFPKAVYTPLFLHPANLMFICHECNEIYKRDADVLQAGREPLDKVFLPYRDTVKEHAQVVIHRTAGTDCVKLLATDRTMAEQKRIDHFDRLYHLEERWSSDIGGIFEEFRKIYANRNLSREELRRKLGEKCEELQALSEFPDKFLELTYVNWLCDTMFDAFYDSLQPIR